jgi:hypothetical protein
MRLLPNEIGELFGYNPPDRSSPHDVDDPRGERGTMVPLYTRLMRAFAGDPTQYYTAISTGPTVIQTLGNPVDARQAVLYVSGGSIIYRVDGSSPSATGDQVITQGSTITLTGKPSILGFQWAAAVAGSVTLYGTFYD